MSIRSNVVNSISDIVQKLRQTIKIVDEINAMSDRSAQGAGIKKQLQPALNLFHFENKPADQAHLYR